MFQILGPWPEIEGLVELPNPQLEDSKREQLSVIHRRTMSGGSRTNVRVSGSETFNWSFVLTNRQAKELETFYTNFCGNKVLVKWNGTDYIGSIVTNPLDFNSSGRDKQQVSFEFVLI